MFCKNFQCHNVTFFLTQVVTIWHIMFMIRSLTETSPAPHGSQRSPCAGRMIRVAVVPKMSTRNAGANPTRASRRSMLPCPGPKFGGESNPFGRHARVTDFPDPPVCPPRVEGAYVADRRRPLPSPLFPHDMGASSQRPRVLP